MRVEFTLVRSARGAGTDNGRPNANPETLLQLIAASNHRCNVLGADVSLQGTDPSAAPVMFQFLVQDDAGTPGGGATALVGVKNDRGYDETIQTTFAAFDVAASAEPGDSGVVVAEFSVHEQGTFQWRPPMALTVKTAERLGFTWNRATYVDVSVTLYCEE